MTTCCVVRLHPCPNDSSGIVSTMGVNDMTKENEKVILRIEYACYHK